ncbi:MAG TPA: WD40 repeat domain-containing protein, partial [Pirellulaceae bacterium]
FADDLRRFLANEPIRARPASWAERAGKWIARHPTLAALAAAMVLGILGISWQWYRAETHRASAERQTEATRRAQGRERAEHRRVERLLYAHDISLAHHEWESHHPTRALRLLEACPPARRHWEWHFLNERCREAIWDSPPMAQSAIAVAFSPDGHYVAASTGTWGINRPGEIRLWDTLTGEEHLRLKGHSSSIMDVAFSPDGKRLVSAGLHWHSTSPPGGVNVWDVASGAKLGSIDANAFCAAFSPDGHDLAFGRHDGRVILTPVEDVTAGRPPQRVDRAPLIRHRTNVFDIAFRPDGKYLASASRDGTFQVASVPSREVVSVIEGLGDVREVAFSPNNRELAVGTFAGQVKVYEQAAERLIEVAHWEQPGAVASLEFSPDGQYLAIGRRWSGVSLVDAHTGREIRTFPGHNQNPHDVSFAADGMRLATSGGDGVVKVWDMTAPTQPLRYDLPDGPFVAAWDESPRDGQIALASAHNTANNAGTGEFTIRIWDPTTAEVTSELRGHRNWLTAVAYNHDGTKFVTASHDRTARIWNTATKACLQTLRGHTGAITNAGFVGSSDQVLTASRDGTIRLWNAGDGSQIQHVAFEGQPITQLVLEPKGHWFAAATDSGTLYLCEPQRLGQIDSTKQKLDSITAQALH